MDDDYESVLLVIRECYGMSNLSFSPVLSRNLSRAFRLISSTLPTSIPDSPPSVKQGIPVSASRPVHLAIGFSRLRLGSDASPNSIFAGPRTGATWRLFSGRAGYGSSARETNASSGLRIVARVIPFKRDCRLYDLEYRIMISKILVA